MNEVNFMPNNSKCLIFLSWQSDRHDCRNFVSSVIEQLPKQLDDVATIEIDRDTSNIPGSPDIGDTIFEKINRCDFFVADITLINDRGSQCRRTPNPNVLIELGYAIKAVGWDRIILLQCKDYGDIEELPFDINHRRIASFTMGVNEADDQKKQVIRSESKKLVINNIAESIKLLKSKNQLYGGSRGKIPKFDILWKGNQGYMMNLKLKIRNVSSMIISSLNPNTTIHIEWPDKSSRDVQCNPKFEMGSLMPGEETILDFYNEMLGAGPQTSNATWENYDFRWQFSCEDEEGIVYWYEVYKHINNPEKIYTNPQYQSKFIG